MSTSQQVEAASAGTSDTNGLDNPFVMRPRRPPQFSLWAVMLLVTVVCLLLAVIRREVVHPAVWAIWLSLGISAALVGSLLRGRVRRLLLKVCGLVFVGLTACYVCVPASLHYRILGDEPSMRQILSKQLQGGDSMAHVQTLLGRGEKPSTKFRADLERLARICASEMPDQYPDGAQSDDEFLVYKISGCLIHLQFRNGKLINFNPGDYEQPFELRALGS